MKHRSRFHDFKEGIHFSVFSLGGGVTPSMWKTALMISNSAWKAGRLRAGGGLKTRLEASDITFAVTGIALFSIHKHLLGNGTEITDGLVGD